MTISIEQTMRIFRLVFVCCCVHLIRYPIYIRFTPSNSDLFAPSCPIPYTSFCVHAFVVYYYNKTHSTRHLQYPLKT